MDRHTGTLYAMWAGGLLVLSLTAACAALLARATSSEESDDSRPFYARRAGTPGGHDPLPAFDRPAAELTFRGALCETPVEQQYVLYRPCDISHNE
jgi:hypothetical protein